MESLLSVGFFSFFLFALPTRPPKTPQASWGAQGSPQIWLHLGSTPPRKVEATLETLTGMSIGWGGPAHRLSKACKLQSTPSRVLTRRALECSQERWNFIGTSGPFFHRPSFRPTHFLPLIFPTLPTRLAQDWSQVFDRFPMHMNSRPEASTPRTLRRHHQSVQTTIHNPP